MIADEKINSAKLLEKNELLGKDLIRIQNLYSAETEKNSNKSTAHYWRGSGTKTTQPFKIKGPWILKWHIYDDELDAANIAISVMKHSRSGQADVIANANSSESGEGESWVYASGTFYLDIASIFCNYKIWIEKPQ